MAHRGAQAALPGRGAGAGALLEGLHPLHAPGDAGTAAGDGRDWRQAGVLRSAAAAAAKGEVDGGETAGALLQEREAEGGVRVDTGGLLHAAEPVPGTGGVRAEQREGLRRARAGAAGEERGVRGIVHDRGGHAGAGGGIPGAIEAARFPRGDSHQLRGEEDRGGGQPRDRCGGRERGDARLRAGGEPAGAAKEGLLDLLEPGVLPAEFTEKVREIPLMDSVFMLHLGVDKTWPEVLRCASTYFYGSYDIEGQVKQARAGIYHEGAAGFVVHLPTPRTPRCRRGQAPR